MAQTAAKVAKPNVFTRLGRYFNDVRAEMGRVVWPRREEVINSSWVVVITLIMFIVVIGSLDYVFSFVVRGLAGLGG